MAADGCGMQCCLLVCTIVSSSWRAASVCWLSYVEAVVELASLGSSRFLVESSCVLAGGGVRANGLKIYRGLTTVVVVVVFFGLLGVYFFLVAVVFALLFGPFLACAWYLLGCAGVGLRILGLGLDC